jgi:hypothetical protein
MQQPEFYPRDLWQHSAVYNSFVKLFCKDIHSLQHIKSEGYLEKHTFDLCRLGLYAVLVKSPDSMGTSNWDRRGAYSKGKGKE